MQGSMFWFLSQLFLSGISTRFCTNENMKAKKYWAKKRKISPNLGLQPRDEAAMLGVNTIKFFLEEFTWKYSLVPRGEIPYYRKLTLHEINANR